ncbi:MAG: carboxypeptidase-like regulatory domain-containing protein [Lewinella sp.]|nr:carboxypeptidase-like regulatory domain-containing protein [Lewinella sp.]
MLIMARKLLLFAALLFIGWTAAQAQDDENDNNLVQLSGLVLDGSTEELIPVPYANILVQDKDRGTYSDFNGFFSIVVEKGDVIIFSSIGYKTVEFTVPDTLSANRYSVVQLMTQDAYNLPETVVFPWPSREHFRLEFLAMDVTPELQERAAENLAEENLAQMRNEVPSDGVENANYYLRQQSRQYYYIGQRPPMNIFSPVAWKKFFDSWKNGDFRREREDRQ